MKATGRLMWAPVKISVTPLLYSHHVSLGSFRLWEFVSLSEFLMTLTILRDIDKVFCRVSLTWHLSGVVLMISLRFSVLRGQKEEKFHFHYIISRVHTINMTGNFPRCSLSSWANLPLFPVCWEFLIINGCWILSILGSQLIWSYDFPPFPVGVMNYSGWFSNA